MNEIIALQKYENEAQLAKELIRGFWLAHGDYVITDEEAAENLAAWTDKGHVFYFILKEEIPIGFVHLGSRGAEVDWIEDLFVPAEITVHALYICILIHRMIGVTVTVHGNRVAVRIFRLRQIVKRLSQ